MTRFYCSNCWVFVDIEYKRNANGVVIDDGELVIDKITKKCKGCEDPTPHHNTLRTHCKRGHPLSEHRMVKGKMSRTCKICARLAEQRHRDRNPGYHNKYKKENKT